MFKRHYLKILKYFLKFLLNFCNLHKIQCISKKKDQLHSSNISELIDSDKYGYRNTRKLPLQNIVGQLTCSPVAITAEISTEALTSQFSIKLRNQKTSLVVRYEILGLFCNTLTVVRIYYCHNSEKFLKHVETPLSQKPKIFSAIFIEFLQST